ncbi:MAG TPA: lysylphosphatidylglycerol synthase domain-containing protein, partial [Burkholderiaceae bacterium]
MKRIAYVLGLAGLAAAIALVARAGWQAVLDALAAAGWPLLWLLPLHVVPLSIDALGWRVLLAPRDPDSRAGWPVLLLVAMVREAVNRLLPVAGVGGELVGVRIVTGRGLEPTPVAASVVTEVVLTLLSLVLFAAFGLAMLFALTARGVDLNGLELGVLIALAVPLAG